MPDFKINGEWKIPSKSGYGFEMFYAASLAEVYGGLPRVRKAIQTNKPVVTAKSVYEFKNLSEVAAFWEFYNTTIQQGAVPFNCVLNIDGANREYAVQLTQSGCSVNGMSDEALVVSMTVFVELDINEEELIGLYEANQVISYEELMFEFLYVTRPFNISNIDTYPAYCVPSHVEEYYTRTS